MAPVSSGNMVAFMGAAVLGIVGAAAVYVVEHFRQEKRRHAMAQDLARLDSELFLVRQELDKLIKNTRFDVPDVFKTNVAFYRMLRSGTGSRISKRGTSYVNSHDADSSDMEFYDVSDRETEIPSVPIVDNVLKDLDKDIENFVNLESCLERLTDLCIEQPESPHLLWRIGWTHYQISERCEKDADKLNHITKGLEACQSALNLNDRSADAHKWYAILIGSRSKLQPLKEKIIDGNEFKKHLDIALTLDPDSYFLHHLSGRFCYEVASLKWYERKVAATLFADPPSATYDEALQHFLDADRLNSTKWNENQLWVAKCYIALDRIGEAVPWLRKAAHKLDDEAIRSEVNSLLGKYGNSR